MHNNLTLARRHLFKAFALSAVALLTKATPGRAQSGYRRRDCVFPFPFGENGPVCCFRKGTRVRVPGSERRVEDLAIGDFIVTLDQGIQRVKALHHFDSSTPPVRIARAAFAPAVPNRDLYLTAGHAIWTAGGFATAESLVNDRTITFESVGKAAYYHVELPNHAVLYANGLTCESLGHGELVLGTRRSRIKSHLRSAMAPWIDRRNAVDVVRDELLI